MRKLFTLILLLTVSACGNTHGQGYYFADEDITKRKFTNEDELIQTIELSEKQQELIGYGGNYLGTRYRYGGESPKKGFDCSGFTKFVYENSLGITLPRSAKDMAEVGNEVAPTSLHPGDLLIFDFNRSLDHVGIYIGDGKFFHASPQQRKIVVGDLHNLYFATRFNSARRVLQ